MSEIIEIYQNIPIFTPLLSNSEWLNVSSAKYVTFTTWNDQTYDMGVRYAIDNQYVVVDTEVYTVLANASHTIYISTKYKFIQLYINNIGATPSALATQGFFY